MQLLFEAVLSNLIVASLIAVLALLLARVWRQPAVLHLLWLIVLLKLVTPPLIPLACLPPLPGWSPINPPAENKDIDVPVESHNGKMWDLNHPFHDEFPVGDDPPVAAENDAEPALAADPFVSEPFHDDQSVNAERRRQTPSTALIMPTLPTTRFWVELFVAVWLIGALVWYAVAMLRMMRFRRVLRLASPAPRAFEIKIADLSRRYGLSRTPEVKWLPGAIAPMIWAPGRRACLLLPREFVRCISPKKLEALITHEIGHLRCRHHWVRRFEMLLTGLYWWCPLVWIARRKLCEYEEEICDAWVVASVPGIAEVYANTLLDTVDFLTGSKPSLPPAAVGISHFQSLNRRITMIMQNETASRLPLAGWLVLLAVLVLALPLSPTSATTTDDDTNSVASQPERFPVQDEDEDEQERDEDEDQDEDKDEDEDEGDEEDEDEGDDADEFIEELLEEMTEEIAEMNEEIESAIEEAREEIQEGISDAPAEVLAALAEIDVNRIVRNALRDAPKTVQMFVAEVNPAGIIAEILQDADVDSGVSRDVAEQVREKITAEITEHIHELSRHVNSQITDVRQEIAQGLAELPPEIRREIARINFDEIIADVTEDSNEIVKQFVRDLKVRETINRALRGREGERSRTRERPRDRERDDARAQAEADRAEAREARTRERAQARERAARDRERRARDREQAAEQRARDRERQGDRPPVRDDSSRDEEDREKTRAELEQRIQQLLEELDAIRRELRRLDDGRRDR